MKPLLALSASLLLTALASVAQVGAGTALRFDGADDYVSVSHDSALNALPLTITAWIRTSRTALLYDGVVNKYFPGAGNGYSLHVYNGRLRAWYFRNGSNYVYPGDPGFDGGFIADGQWHHVALVITATGGAIYIDGSSRGTPQSWTGTPGPATTSTPITIGRYSTSSLFTNTFAGDIDEVGIWNRALTLNELNYLKHRCLKGNEDGLLSLWHFDEGSGGTSADATSAGRIATLNGAVLWKTSAAPIALAMRATNCLRFDGVSGYVQSPHNSDLNAFPFTASAWFRTTDSMSFGSGVVSKYMDASGNGWSIIVQSGRLRAFYYRTGANFAMDAVSAASVADGGWHHAAMVVDNSGGKLFLDGSVVGTGTWSGSPGAPTGTEPLQIGRYYNYAQRFVGALDEITVWNRALSTTEIQSLKNLPLAGNESGLVAYWRLDEGFGTTATDATGHGHDGSLVSAPAWTGSTAYLGDGSVHLLAATDVPFNQRYFAINGGYQVSAFAIKANTTFWRFYDFGPTPPNSFVGYTLAAGLQIASTGTLLAVKPNTYSNAFSFAAYNASGPIDFGASAGMATINQDLNVEPANGVQLDSINNLHQMTATLSHNENGGAFSNDGTEGADITRLLHFNGHLRFGNIDTVVSNILNTPTNDALFVPTHLQSQLQITLGGAYLAAAPGVHFGGATSTVNLGVDGTATNVAGLYSLTASDQFFEANGIRYQLPGARLNNSGLIATNLLAWFPAGFGMSVTTNVHTMLPFASKANVAIGTDLLPTVSTLTFTAASYNTNRLWFADETKPFLIGASQIEWHIPQGEFFISEVQSLLFVREKDDRDLSNESANLVDPLAADRVSNDTYYRHIAAVPGVPIYIRPDTNGASWLTMQAALQENEYRPHFPYLNRSIGGHIPVVGGALAISNSLIDPGGSYLLLANPAPIPYARDCAPEAGCTSFATIGPQILNFTAPPGHLGLGELSFTRDGGLLAYGSIAPTNLTWGYIGGTNFAQRTSDVQAGALEIAGTFLRGDLTTTADAQRPAALLFTGWGDQTNSAYLERPDQPAYANGFANYAGLNFRAPAQGRSFIAGQDSNWYPLTPRAKYYTRFGGVSGIHEAASFPSGMALYGYPFTFLGYRLSFLDSDNWESRTDGAVALGGPAGFNVEFERMKFLCRGNLDSAQLPPSIGTKHMVYWNADIKPQSLQFKPPLNDACNLSNRFLVLGVETKLPFIPNAFHAALGFKPNGNLVTKATAVEGVDSRFAVPANLKLQGPGGSYYPLTTAGDGYFNNWETPGKPDSGFYNIAARVRVPFFRDIKVQVHVTPTGPNTAQLNLMGGWPAEEGAGQNRGWNVGSQNYFNTAKFDANADGWPTRVSLNNYRNSPDQTYRPRAQRNWIDVAGFDYPLAWNSVLRQFAGYADVPVTLPVIDVNSRLKEITPGKVDLDFAQDINLQLPRIKVLDLANDAVNEINGPLNTVSNAIRAAFGGVFTNTGVASGFVSLQNMMRENVEGFFRPVLDEPLSNIVEVLYPVLSNALIVSKGNLLNGTAGIVGAGSNGLQTAIQNINGTAANANKILGQVNKTLTDVDDTLGLFIRVLEKDGSGNRHVVRIIIQKLAQDQGPALGIVANLGDSLVNDLLADLEPTLAKIETELRNLRAQFNQIRMQVGTVAVDSDFDEAITLANHETASLQNYLGQAGYAVSNLLNSVVGPAADYFTANPTRAKQEIRERLIMAFLSSPIPGKYQQTFRQFLYDKNFLLDQLIDVLFDQINRSIRNGLANQIAGARDGIFQNMKGGGLLSQSLLSAKIRGAPTFEGDSLRKIHLDSAIKVNLPDEMKFPAYMDIKELNSATTPVACIPSGAPSAEVTLGANDVPLDWAGVPSTDPGGQKMTLSVAARWTLQSGSVKGIGGSLDIKGRGGFKGCNMSEIRAALAIGSIENYFAGQAKATVIVLGVPVDFRAGIFAGHACSLEPLKLIDPEVEQVIMQAGEFSGVYLEYGGGLSLSDILFAESSDLLDVRADITTALFYQGGPRFGRIGGRQKVSVNIKLLYVLEGSASWAVFAVLDTAGQLTVGGSAEVCGRIGICPVCKKACKDVTIKGVINEGGIDYFIDY